LDPFIFAGDMVKKTLPEDHGVIIAYIRVGATWHSPRQLRSTVIWVKRTDCMRSAAARHLRQLYCSLPAGSAAGSSAGISFTHGPILVRSSLPNLTLIGSGLGVYGPQN